MVSTTTDDLDEASLSVTSCIWERSKSGPYPVALKVARPKSAVRRVSLLSTMASDDCLLSFFNTFWPTSTLAMVVPLFDV